MCILRLKHKRTYMGTLELLRGTAKRDLQLILIFELSNNFVVLDFENNTTRWIAKIYCECICFRSPVTFTSTSACAMLYGPCIVLRTTLKLSYAHIILT